MVDATRRRVGAGLTAVALAILVGAGPASDKWHRPTVIVIRGNMQGSGTIIASVPGEALVLTAAHVVANPGEAKVEVHRYNMGLERLAGDGWPKRLSAKVVATDVSADVAVLKIEGAATFPFVARVVRRDGEAMPGETVVSVGVDKGEALSSWGTKVVDHAQLDMADKADLRPFLLTAKAPEHGRSGGGLFRPDGTVVGVCVGRAQVIGQKRFGVFASGESVRRILRENKLDDLVSRSMARRLPRPVPVERTKGPAPSAPAPAPAPRPPSPSDPPA